MDIAGWLRSLGLEQYAPAFRDNDIEANTLSQLTVEDLIALGVTSIGHRRKFLTAVEALRNRPTSAPPPVLPVLAESAGSRAERRQLTVMFIDLVGSTELSQGLDPEDMRDVIQAFQGAVSAEIIRYEGKVAKLMGDAVLAYFGWPRAHEDDAERAIRSGLAAAAATAGLTAPGGGALSARVGIATGLVVVGDLVGEGSAQEEAVVGDTPNLAARLQSVAAPGSVVIAEGTHRLVAGFFESVDIGNQTLKGFAADVRAWRIVGDAGSENRFEARQAIASPLVGRVEELALVLESWRRAREGTGQVVLLSGEAGIGKSRLIAALDERLGIEPHWRARYFCSPYHVNSALHPVITQLERSAGFSRDDGPSAKFDKLEAVMRRASAERAEAVPLLAALLSLNAAGRFAPLQLTPSVQKARTFALLVQLIEAHAEHQPVVIFVEDAHWMDPTTGEWLDTLIDHLKALPVCLVVTSRPGFQPRWMNLSNVVALSLGRLASDQSAAIIDRVAGGKALPAEVTREILAKTEGVPLFVEELTKTVLDSGLLVDSGDCYVLSGPLPALAIPSTLQDSLMARLDRLASAKEVAQIGACIGRSFEHRLLAAVTRGDEVRLAVILEELEESELVFRRGIPPAATYTFKHALVRDTAYQSLLKSRRQQIHAKIAATLESQFQEIVEAEPETLAHHYTVAGLGEQAVVYWLTAGQRALRRSANLEAAAHLNKGLELIGSLPESEARLRQELSLQTALGTGMMAAKGFGAPEVLQAFSRARVLAETVADKTQLFGSMRGESAYRTISGNLRTAEKLGHQCQALGLELAQASGNSEFILEADHQLWGINYYLGDYNASEHYAGRGLAAYDHERHRHLAWGYTGHDPGVCCRTFSAWILCMRGQSDQAIQRSREAVTLAERDLHPLSMAQAQIGLSFVHLLRNEPDETRKWAERAIALCTEFVMPLLVSQARVYLGWALSRQGHVEEGIPRIREGIEGIRKTGADMGMAYYLCILARTCGENGEPGEGLALLEEAFDNLAKLDSKYQIPELLCAQGELLSEQIPRNDAAQSCFTQSLTAAREQGALWSELRAASRLARLFVGQRRESDAQNLLAPIYARFNEGFATHDLKEAKHLLETLPPQTLAAKNTIAG